MTELLPKPKIKDFDEEWITDDFIIAERDYYKRLAEFAVFSLNRISNVDLQTGAPDPIYLAKQALSTIKQGDL